MAAAAVPVHGDGAAVALEPSQTAAVQQQQRGTATLREGDQIVVPVGTERQWFDADLNGPLEDGLYGAEEQTLKNTLAQLALDSGIDPAALVAR